MRYAFAVASIVCLAACTRVGHKFDPAAVDRLQAGVSTTSDAIVALGKPTAESSIANGSRLLQWQYSQGSMVGANGAHVAILFDAQGRMVRVTHRFQI